MIRPTLSLTEAPLVRPKGLTKGRERLVFCQYFSPVIFYTHILYPHITFLWHTLYFPLQMHSPIIRAIIYFGKIIIDIIVLWKEKKDMYYFGRKINNIFACWKEN